MGIVSAGAANHAAGSLGGIGRDKDKTRSGGGAGTKALMPDAPTITRGPQPAPGPNARVTQGTQAPVTTDRNVTLDSRGEITRAPNSGLHTQDQYSPGAVPAVPDASMGQLLSTALKALPGVGAITTAVDVVDGVTKGKVSTTPDGGLLGRAIDSLTGGSPGLQRGWEPDRSRGAPGNPDDARGTKPGDLIDRAAGTIAAAVGGESSADADADVYSDVMTKDRRKPYEKMSNAELMGIAL